MIIKDTKGIITHPKIIIFTSRKRTCGSLLFNRLNIPSSYVYVDYIQMSTKDAEGIMTHPKVIIFTSRKRTCELTTSIKSISDAHMCRCYMITKDAEGIMTHPKGIIFTSRKRTCELTTSIKSVSHAHVFRRRRACLAKSLACLNHGLEVWSPCYHAHCDCAIFIEQLDTFNRQADRAHEFLLVYIV